MSLLKYFNPVGFGTNLSVDFHYSQAVQLPGNIIKLSGQGGWDPITGEIVRADSAELVADQVDRAFVNVDEILRLAGAEGGWRGVYQVRSYVVGIEEFDGAVMTATVASLQKWCPEHKPLLTAVPVERLVLDGMRIEVEVEAFHGGRKTFWTDRRPSPNSE